MFRTNRRLFVPIYQPDVPTLRQEPTRGVVVSTRLRG